MFEMVVWAWLVCGIPLIWAVIRQGGIALMQRPTPVERWDVPLWPITEFRRTTSDPSLSADSWA
jgi:hypothetical protein